MRNNQRSDRQPTMQFSVVLLYDIWKELDKIKREEGIPKGYIINEGLRKWLEQHSKAS